MNLRQLYKKKIDKILWNEVFEYPFLEEVKGMVDHTVLNTLPLGEGAVYPIPYSMVHKEFLFNKDEYVQQNQEAIKNSTYNKATTKIEEVFNKLETQNITLLPLEEQSFTPLNIRKLTSSKGGLSVHCENYFIHQLDKKFLEIINEKVDIKNILSFVVMIDQPEMGGEICIYDEEWDEVKLTHLNAASYFEEKDVTKVNLKNNQMLIFRAGQQWHFVADIQGSKDRITLGGFIGYSKNEDKFYFWS